MCLLGLVEKKKETRKNWAQAEAAECAKKFEFETYETVTVSVARSKKMGRYHMMSAQNPVTVVTLAGGNPK